MNGIRYFSMFTGVGGFEIGIGDKAKCVGFSEIDKYASQLLANKWPHIRNYGDATKINPNELPDFDMLCGGFPCQSFSIAGNRGGFNDIRGTMFFEVARILEVKRPKIVFLENVKGLLNHDKGKTFRVIIQTLSELGYDVQWMVLNSKFFGVPQNRERVFIIGSLRGTSRPEILPFREVSESFNEQDISHTLPSSYHKITRGTTMIDDSKINAIIGGGSQQSRLYNIDGCGPTLAGASKLSGDCTPRIAIPVLTPDRLEKRQNGRRFKENGEEAFTLTKTDIHGVSDGFKIRKLTPIECERLQGFPDKWTSSFSDTQRYKMMGNAVTTKVISAIAERLIK